MAEGPDRFQRRHHWVGFPIAVAYKYFDDSGTYLAAILTYYAFVSLFPLLLIASAVLGLVLAGNEHLQEQLLSSALQQFPLIGRDLMTPRHLGGGPAGLIVGIVGALYGGLGVAQAFQYAANAMWAVPRNSRPNPLRTRARSLVLLATAGLGVLVTTLLSVASSGGAGLAGSAERYGALAASVAINITILIFAFRFAPARKLSVRDVTLSAVISAGLWQLLQSFGILYVRHVVRHASTTNAVFEVVLGLLAYLYLSSTVILLCMEISVVRVNRMYPRALLTPLTDNVELTTGDRRAYSRQAKAQRFKAFERVDVSFDQHDQEGPAPLTGHQADDPAP